MPTYIFLEPIEDNYRNQGFGSGSVLLGYVSDLREKTGSGSDPREKTGSGSEPREKTGSGSDPREKTGYGSELPEKKTGSGSYLIFT